MPNKRYIIGGKLGDFFHSLYVVKCFCEELQEKAVIFISINPIYGGDIFRNGIENAFTELKNTVLQQSYVNSFEILPEHISEECLNLNTWRLSPNLYKINWSNLLSIHYGCKITNDAWIKSVNVNDLLKGKVIIHHSTVRHVEVFPWEEIVKQNDCVFLGFNQIEYDSF